VFHGFLCDTMGKRTGDFRQVFVADCPTFPLLTVRKLSHCVQLTKETPPCEASPAPLLANYEQTVMGGTPYDEDLIGVIREFTDEARDHIDDVEPRLLELEKKSTEGGIDEETVNLIFRLFHSIKGNASALDFNNVAHVTHAAESLVDLFRKGVAAPNRASINVLCRAVDRIRKLIEHIVAENTDLVDVEQSEVLTKEIEAMIASLQTPAVAVAAPPAKPVVVEKVEAPRASVPSQASPASDASGIDPGMTSAFVNDTEEQLDTLEATFVRAARSPGDIDDLNAAFRAMHNIKGNAGLLGHMRIQKIAHEMESELLEAREAGRGLTAQMVQQMLPQLDVLRGMVRNLGSRSMPPPSMPVIAPQAKVPAVRVSSFPNPAEHPDQKPVMIGQILVEQGSITEQGLTEALAIQQKPLGEMLVATGKVAQAEVDSALKLQKERKPAAAPAPQAQQHNIRVDLNKLDLLMNLVGELVIAETMVAQHPDLEAHRTESVEKASRHLNKIVRDMQDIATSLRMIPVGGSLRKMLRLVHDLAAKQGKLVDLAILGEETEVDKTVTELIADPLVHILRNGVDHGVETPDVRRAAGKPERATIRLEAKHQGGEVLIIVEDDGKGLDKERILAKAKENGLVPQGSPPLPDAEIFKLIFEPGFSTADKVTDVSGRGVGMDVVKRNVEKMRGRVDINSVRGQGTTVTLRIPLTLAIIEGMLVRVGSSFYTIPLGSIRESIVPRSKEITRTSDSTEIVRVRDSLIPVLRLHKLHNLKPERESLDQGVLTIVEEGGERIALFIDELVGQRQTVIKSLPNFLGSIRGVSGCSLLGSGEISLILDVSEIVKLGPEDGPRDGSAAAS
jgi:two-component system chemotaxis sensor kinase CheA